jgi:bacterioferritin-associated ferredoxin
LIVCSCNVLTDKELRRAARELQSGPERSVVTPGAVFRALGKRPRCGGCFSTIIPMIHEEAADEAAAPAAKQQAQAPEKKEKAGNEG